MAVTVYIATKEEMGGYDSEEIFCSLVEAACEEYLKEVEGDDEEGNCSNYWIDKKEFPSEEDAISYIRRGDTEVWEVFFSLDSPQHMNGSLQERSRWIFANETPLLTWVKWNNPHAPRAGTIYVPITEANPLEVARQYVPVNI